MADYVMLRRGRNALSTFIHAVLNIALAVGTTALTVISGNWIFGILLVVLSKWRVIAVRPRYWWLNIKANLVDFIVGISIALLVFRAGTLDLNIWHVILTIFYAVWLVVVKPRSSAVWAEIQSLFATFFGTFAVGIMTAQLDPIFAVILCFIIGYSASRHILMQGEDHDFTVTTFTIGMIMAELGWILYHWTIVYRISETSASLVIPQLPIVSTIMFFVFMRGYKSALRHDGKIRTDDMLLPAVFSILIILVMVFFFSGAYFDI